MQCTPFPALCHWFDQHWWFLTSHSAQVLQSWGEGGAGSREGTEDPGEDNSQGTGRQMALLPGTVKIKGDLSVQESPGG